MRAAKHKRRFTDQMIERLNAPSQGRLEFGDAVCPGLLLRVTERGVKTFSVIYKVPGEGGVSTNGLLLRGRQHRVTIGCWPTTRLPKAREEAGKLMREATEGRDPRNERREQNLIRHTNTFEAVQNRFIEQYAERNLRNWKTVKSTFLLHVCPEWGDRPIRDIRRGEVHELLDGIVAKGRIGTAREVRKHLSRLFNWAMDREIVTENPLHALKREELRKNEEAGRALNDEELGSIWRGTEQFGYPLGPMFQLLMLTGQRRGDWARASRSEVNTDKRWLEVPRARYKGRRDHIVPLTDAAWAIVEGLPWWSGDASFLFSSRAGKVPVSCFSQAKADLDAYALTALRETRGDPKAELAYYRIHDFRVTCETRLANLGFNQEVRDAVLGHAKVGLQKTYNKHDYLEEKRSALSAYGSHIHNIVS